MWFRYISLIALLITFVFPVQAQDVVQEVCRFERHENIVVMHNALSTNDAWVSAETLYTLSEWIKQAATDAGIDLSSPIFDKPLLIHYMDWFEGKPSGFAGEIYWNGVTCSNDQLEYDPTSRQSNYRYIGVFTKGTEMSWELETTAHELSHAWGGKHGNDSPDYAADIDRGAVGPGEDAYWYSYDMGRMDETQVPINLQGALGRAYAVQCKDMVGDRLTQDPWCHVFYGMLIEGRQFDSNGREIEQ
jgi:hypothetical protein